MIGDPHYHSENGDVGSPNDRQVAAILALPGTAHPLGGVIASHSAVIVVGDLTHEAQGTTARYASHYSLDGSGQVHPAYEVDGDHDQQQTRDLIVARHGSLTYGVKIGPVWFQMMTEDYTSPLDSRPPSAAQINGAVAAGLAARPAGEPTFLVVHRALTGGYVADWAPDAQDALEALAHSHNLLGIIHGHDHYSHFTTWRGIRVISPGSVRQAPEQPPYSTTYAESFVVLRIGHNWWDAASYVFGFDVNRLWAPGTWEWVGRELYLPYGPGVI